MLLSVVETARPQTMPPPFFPPGPLQYRNEAGWGPYSTPGPGDRTSLQPCSAACKALGATCTEAAGCCPQPGAAAECVEAFTFVPSKVCTVPLRPEDVTLTASVDQATGLLQVRIDVAHTAPGPRECMLRRAFGSRGRAGLAAGSWCRCAPMPVQPRPSRANCGASLQPTAAERLARPSFCCAVVPVTFSGQVLDEAEPGHPLLDDRQVQPTMSVSAPRLPACGTT